MASTIGCDRVTKHMAAALLADKPPQSFLADSVRLEYAENAGGFLSLGAGLPPVVRTSLFTIMTGMALVVVLVTLLRSRSSSWRALGLALFIAGGVSNWGQALPRCLPPAPTQSRTPPTILVVSCRES
jgi:signal peptidase II